MKMAYAILPALLLCSGAVFAQSAQTNSGATSQSPNSTTSTSNMSMRQQIKDTLQKDGYQDVSVLPASFVVHAKDKNGHLTAMVITPDSTFVVTDDAATNGAATNGAGGNHGASSSQGAPH